MSDKADFKDQFKSYQDDISNAMAKVWSDRDLLPDVVWKNEEARVVIEMLEEFSLRPSKRIRGILSMVLYECLGGKDKDTALKLAVALELSQNYLLVIDDVMDKSKTRRGGPTVHMQYLERLASFKHPNESHIADMVAVTAGAIVQHISAQVIASINDVADKDINLLHKVFQQNVMVTGFGQIGDLTDGYTASLNEETIRHMYEEKSSYYTFINPMDIAAVVTGKYEENKKVIHEIGVPAGIAFQMVDDMIGMFGDKTLSGKSNTDDVREGKMTMPMYWLIQEVDKSDLRKIYSVFGVEGLKEDEYLIVSKLARKHEIDIKTRKYVSRLIADAESAIKKQEQWGKTGRDFLLGLMDYISKRDH